MERGVVKVFNCKGDTTSPFPHSNNLHKEPRSTQLSDAVVDDQETDACNHFAIRGYVDSMRKKDAKICWPFFMLDDVISEEQAAKLLPPMPVIHFKRWNCLDCLQRTNALATVDQNDVVDFETKSTGSVLHRRCDAHADHENKSSKSLLFAKKAPSFVEGEEGNTGKVFTGIKSVPFDAAGVNTQLNKSTNELLGCKETDARSVFMNNNGTIEKNEVRVGVLEEFAHSMRITPQTYPTIDSAVRNDDQDAIHVGNKKATSNGGPCPYDNELESRENSENIGFWDGELHHKKVRKVRLLSDIYNSEELRSSKLVQSSNGDIKGRICGKRLAVKAKFKDRKCSFSETKDKSGVNGREHDNEPSGNENKGTSLLHWLNKVSRTNISSEEAKVKLIKNCNNDVSKGAPSASLEKIAALNGEDISIREIDKVNPSSAKVISEDIILKQLGPCRTKQERTAESHHLDLITKNSNLKKAKRGRKTRISPIEGPKRTFATEGFSNKRARSSVGDLPDNKKARKKEMDAPVLKQDGLDDFPMDIVELLARNQHERRKMNTDTAFDYVDKAPPNTKYIMNSSNGEVSQMAGSLKKDSCGASLELVRQRSVFDGQNTKGGQIFQLNNAGRVPSNTCRIGNTESDDYQIGLNRQTASCHAQVEFCNFQMNDERNFICESISKREDNQLSGPNHYTETSGQYTCMIELDMSKLPSCCSHVQNNLPKNYNFNYMSPATRKACLKSNMVFLSETDYREPANSSGDEQHHSRMDGNSQFYTKEAISAMHLLRLMDPRSSSGQVLRASISTNHLFKGHDNLNKPPRHGTGVNFNEPQARNHPQTFRSPNQDHHTENSYIPVRPLPRFGVLGSLLQKEIAAHSKTSEAPFGFKVRNLNNLTTPEFGCRNDEEESQSAFVSRHLKSRPINHGVDRVRIIDNEVVLRNVNSGCKMEFCTINRNPADFAIPGEDCEFMISSDDLRSRYTSLFESKCPPVDLGGLRRCQKPKKLTKIKEFLRS